MPRTSTLALLLLAACKFPYPDDVNDDGRVADDGGSVDSASGRTGPLVQNGQAADLVLGQPTFEAGTDRGVTDRSFLPAGIAFASGRFWVADEAHHRVLGWDTPTISDRPAGYLLGQPDFTSGQLVPTSASSTTQPTAVVAGENVTVLGDPARALIWTAPPIALAEPADLVLGATNFTDQGQLSNLIAGWSDGQRLILRRGFIRSRLVIWTAYPAVNGAAPDLELLTGFEATQRDFGADGGVTSDGTRLVVADLQQNRVLIWNTWPTASGQPADLVLGQPTFTSNATGTSAAAMSGPAGVLIVDGALLVADSRPPDMPPG